MANTLPPLGYMQERQTAISGQMRIGIGAFLALLFYDHTENSTTCYLAEGTKGAWPGDNVYQCAQGKLLFISDHRLLALSEPLLCLLRLQLPCPDSSLPLTVRSEVALPRHRPGRSFQLDLDGRAQRHLPRSLQNFGCRPRLGQVDLGESGRSTRP